MAAESDIADALFARLAQYTAHPIVPPNTDIPKPSDWRYLEPRFVPNVANRMFIGSDDPHQLLGLFQINVHWSKLRGEIEPRLAAEAVAALFPCDLRLPAGDATVRVTKRADIREMIISNDMPDVIVPVIVSWEAYA